MATAKNRELQSIETRSFGKPDEVRPFEKGKLELVHIGGRTVGRATFEPGWKWSECVGPIAKTSTCEAAHFGYQISGTMHIASSEGEYDIHAGEVFNLPPGHDGWVVGDETVVVVDFQGMVDYAKPKAGAQQPQGGAQPAPRPGRKH